MQTDFNARLRRAGVQTDIKRIRMYPH